MAVVREDRPWSAGGVCVDCLKARSMDEIVAAPKFARLLEPLRADADGIKAEVVLSDAEYAELNEALEHLVIHGTRDGKDIRKLGSVPESVIK